MQLLSVWFTSKDIGYAVGGDQSTNTGIILKTTNGGNSWTSKLIPNNFFGTVRFINANTGYVVGGDIFANTSSIYRTDNAGVSWYLESTSSSRQFGSWFPCSHVGYTSGLNGTILKKSNVVQDTVHIIETTYVTDTILVSDTVHIVDVTYITDTIHIINNINIIDTTHFYDTINVINNINIIDTTHFYDTINVINNINIIDTTYLYDTIHIINNINVFDTLHLFDTVYIVDTIHYTDVIHIVDTLHVVDTTYFTGTIHAVGCCKYVSTIAPNPFYETFTMDINLDNEDNVEIKLLDVVGRELSILRNQTYPKGKHKLTIDDLRNLPGNYYLLQVTIGDCIETIKIIKVD